MILTGCLAAQAASRPGPWHASPRTVGGHDCWTERCPRSRIAPRHDRSHVIAAGVKAGNWLSVAAEHARIRISRKSRADCNVGRPDRKRIEWRRRYRPDARVGFVPCIAVEAVELGFTLTEIDIDTGRGKTVVTRDGVAQLRGIGGDFAGELL